MSENQNDIMDLIPSKAMKKAILDARRVFSDSEKATFIFHCCEDFDARNERLKKILETTSDEKLKKEITERFESDEKFFEAFRKNDGDFVFVAEITNSHKVTEGQFIFADYDEAVSWCKKFKVSDEIYNSCKFIINKHKLYHKGQMPSEDDYREIGYVYFSKRDFPRGYWLEGEIYDECSDRGHYEFQYISLPDPFELGDRVKVLDGREVPYSLVEEEFEWFVPYSKADWIRHEERVQNPNDSLHDIVDWTDVSIPIMYGDIDKDYMKTHEHINPIYLEKIEGENIR